MISGFFAFRTGRLFNQLNDEKGSTEWFFMTREGVFGPYQTKELALKSMHCFVEDKTKAGDDGGRSAVDYDLSLTPLEKTTVYDPLKRKHGVDDE